MAVIVILMAVGGVVWLTCAPPDRQAPGIGVGLIAGAALLAMVAL